MKDFKLIDINNEPQSYQQLINFYNEASRCVFENIKVTIVQWFNANMCAALGGILDEISEVNAIKIDSPKASILTILKKNSFLSHYGFNTEIDTNHTAISFLKLKTNESRYFHSYITNQLLSKQAFPTMTSQLQKKIEESIYEIFVNAQIHSGTEYIYTCGQFFPKKQTIEFTIVDMGKGFKKTINERFQQKLSSIASIKWALQDTHSTKIDIPGGIGLTILTEFIKMNNGKFQIISDDGFYEMSNTHEKTQMFSGSFPGTIINMEFRTDDTNSYQLSSELDFNNIF